MIIDQFLQWSCQATDAEKARATHALARAFVQNDFTEEDRHAAEAAMTFLLDDPSVDVRHAICDVFAGEVNCPRHIILGLVDDIDEIALKVVRCSPVLIDSELIDIMAMRGVEFQHAVAMRIFVGAGVAAAIAEIGEAEACRTLLLNPGASLVPSALLRLTQRFGYHKEIQQMLLRHPLLPVSARQLVIANMSEVICHEAIRSDRLEASRSQDVLRDARDRATLTLVQSLNEDQMAELAEHLLETDQLTTVLLMRAICAGQVAFFVEAVAILSGMPVGRIMSLLVDQASTRTLSALFIRAGLPEKAHPAFAIAFDVYFREGAVHGPADQYRFTRTMIEEILERYKNDASGDMDDILGMLRRYASETARDSARAYVQAQLEAA